MKSDKNPKIYKEKHNYTEKNKLEIELDKLKTISQCLINYEYEKRIY